MQDTATAARILPGQEWHLDNAVVIVSNTDETTSTIRLYLIGQSLKDLDKIRQMLCDQLNFLATASDNTWIHSATVQRNHLIFDNEIVVEINNPSLLGSRSVDLVLGAAKAFVAPFAAQARRDVYALKGKQRLVPLDFDRPVTSTSMEVTLPQLLSFKEPRGSAAEHLLQGSLHAGDNDLDSSVVSRAYLTAALELALDELDWIDRVTFIWSKKGLQIIVNFDYRTAQTPYNVNTTQNTIMEVLARHATLPGSVCNDLVFVSATPAGDNEDDDGGDYSDDGYEY